MSAKLELDRGAWLESLIEMAKKHGIRKLRFGDVEFELSGHEPGPVIPDKPSLYDLMPPDDQMLFMASEGLPTPEPAKE